MLVRGGRIVTESGILDGDVRIEHGRVVEVGTNLGTAGREDVDAGGCWVIPGAIDPHVHTSLAGHSVNEPIVEDLEEASRAALFGGVTTIGAYVHRAADRGVIEMIEYQIDAGRKTSHVDFMLHALCFPGDDPDEVVARGTALGVRAYKVFLSYFNRGLMTEDDDLLRLMTAAAGSGAIVLVHAENGRVIDHLERLARQGARITEGSLLRTAPGEIEAEGIFKTAMLARLSGCTVLFVHLTSKPGAEILAWLKSGVDGERLHAETQPHYLLLTNDAVLDRGPLAKVGPPLKERTDTEAVIEAVERGVVSHLSSDHSPRMRSVKLAKDNILDAPYGGISGVEVLLPLAHRVGMEDGHFGIQQLVRLTSTNAAKLFGVYPRKGTIAPGSDADLAVVPIDGEEHRITPSLLHGRSDYSLYEGITSRGFPRHVIRKGALAVTDGELRMVKPADYLGTGRASAAR